MPRLIDADALMVTVEGNPLTTDSLKEYVRCTVREQPTIDTEPRWIPCSERLPKIGTNVLITNDKGNVSYGRYRGVYTIDGDKVRWTWKKNTLENVLAWMPLPEPYEVEK